MSEEQINDDLTGCANCASHVEVFTSKDSKFTETIGHVNTGLSQIKSHLLALKSLLVEILENNSFETEGSGSIESSEDMIKNVEKNIERTEKLISDMEDMEKKIENSVSALKDVDEDMRGILANYKK